MSHHSIDDSFKIYVDQLKHGRERVIHEVYPSTFIDVNDPELSFGKNVVVDGIAYLAEQELVIDCNIEAQSFIPCSICNELVEVPISIEHYYHIVPLSEIKSGIYSMQECLREAILLEVPAFAECCEGNCPKRSQFARFLKKPSPQDDDDEKYYPFDHLDIK